MKLRESGMPDEDYWESLFDVEGTLDRLGIDSRIQNVVELGCGYGTFTLAVAERIQRTLTALDIDPAMVARTRVKASEAGLGNIVALERDVLSDGFGLASASQDACLLFNILHGEEPVIILTNAVRVVQPGGLVLVTHWRFDAATPRGPSLDIRPRPEDIACRAEQAGSLVIDGPPIDLPPWHFGMRLIRTKASLE